MVTSRWVASIRIDEEQRGSLLGIVRSRIEWARSGHRRVQRKAKAQTHVVTDDETLGIRTIGTRTPGHQPFADMHLQPARHRGNAALGDWPKTP
jgi:hypothetical protein